jgi:hypothetical protein
MANKGTTVESYPDPYTRRIFYDAANLARGLIKTEQYSSKYLQVLKHVLNTKFAYYRLEVRIRGCIMFLKIDTETLIKHEDRI